ncbi:hypothetical protein MalM25_37590 [Planctomycetes bacterium MalM25]|nr:hypothetical protein MalM25_37590 [Planctomycetes bacterium MalM25]
MSGALRRDRLRRRQLRTQRAADRRGVLLLVVLSMLVLFLLVGTTFLITSGQYRTQSKVVEKANRSTFQPADLLERALMQLVRDTNNPSSVIRHHSLLRDLYGVDGFVGRITMNNAAAGFGAVAGDGNVGLIRDPNGTLLPTLPRYAGIDPLVQPADTEESLGPTRGQVIEFYVADLQQVDLGDVDRLGDHNAVGLEFGADGLPVEHQMSTIDGYYEGCLLTMLDGPCRGDSVRVLDYDFLFARNINNNSDKRVVVSRWRVMAPRRNDGKPLAAARFDYATPQYGLTDLVQSDVPANSALGHRFIVNGRPFNGAGVGLNPLAMSHDISNGAPAPRLSALEFVEMGAGSATGYGLERALIPNPVQYFEPANVALNPSLGVDPWSKPGTPGGVYLGSDFVPLTRGYVGPASPTYDPTLNAPLYSGFAGSGDTDESYDAPDTQNMALASQALEPRLRGRVVDSSGASLDPDAYYLRNNSPTSEPPPAYLDLEGVTIPSYHRPALANFWFHRLWNSEWLRGVVNNDSDRVRAILEPYGANGAPQHGLGAADAAVIAGIKRKFLLRPLREDHPEFDGSNPLSRYTTNTLRNVLNSGTLVNDRQTPSDPTDDEITFPYWEAVGPWDVDNDGDGVPDSVWVDLGLPVQQTEDGRWYKPLVAMLVEDLDGRLNLNAHGGEEHLAENFLDASTQNGATLQQNLAQDYAAGASLFSSDQLPEGAGWGVAETSLRPVLSPSLPRDNYFSASAAFLGDAQYDDYARLLQGRPDPTLGTPARTVAAALGGSVEFGRYGTGFVQGLTATDQNGNPHGVRLTTPGRTFVTLPNPIPGTRDERTPLEMFGYPFHEGLLFDRPSGFSSAADLRGRYGAGLSAAGAPVGEPISAANFYAFDARTAGTLDPDDTMTWRGDPNNGIDDSPYELDLSVAARRLAPVSATAIRLTYDADDNGEVDAFAAPLVDDAPFSPAELERLLRAFDVDAGKLPDRLWEIVDSFDPEKLAASYQINTQIQNGTPAPVDTQTATPSTLENVVAAAKAAINRRVVTTESFDLPTPNENWAERIALGADGLPGVPRVITVNGNTIFPNDDGDLGIGVVGVDDDGDGAIDEADEVETINEGDEVIVGYNAATQQHTYPNQVTADYDTLYLAGCDDYVVIMREDPPATPRITDYLRYRVVLELLRQDRILFDDPGDSDTRPSLLQPDQRNLVEALVSQILHGNDRLPTGDPARFAGPHSFGGLLAPELLTGVRMDLNRPLGDGRDNNGNGVVDEPAEAGEPYLFDSSFPGGELVVRQWLDLNKSGTFDQDLDGDGVLYFDTDADGLPDRFDPDDLTDADGDGVQEPLVDHLWIDDDGDGLRDADEFRPFDYTRGADANGRGGVVASGNLGVRDDARLARQLYARHLYCLMLLLTDENYLAPYDSSDPQVVHYLDPLSGAWVDPTAVPLLPAPESSIAFWLAGTIFDGDHTVVQADASTDLSVSPHGPNETRRLRVLAEARRLAQRKLTRRMIAQWAINVVDFRDPDAIQTPFEYDENPWDGWNVVDTQLTADPSDDVVYPLDGDLATDENYTQVRLAEATGFTAPGVAIDSTVSPYNGGNFTIDPVDLSLRPDSAMDVLVPRRLSLLDRTRGVVWGAERPEAILTEGLAWHDRRLEDLDAGGGQLGGDKDDDLDQLRKPKGYVYLEAFNPWTDGVQRPAEFYSHVGRDGVLVPFGGVRFDRLSNLPADPSGDPRDIDSPFQQTRSPVWRLACVEEHPVLRNASISPNLSEAISVALDAGPLADLKQASDDPPNRLNETEGVEGANDYLGEYLAGGPSVYRAPTLPAAVEEPATAYGNIEDRNAPVLQRAYSDLWFDQAVEAFLNLATNENNIRQGVNDADGLAIAVGVIAQPSRLADPSFPTFDRFAQPGAPARSEFVLSSREDGRDSGRPDDSAPGTPKPNIRVVDRTILLKPTRFIERVFYMTSPNGQILKGESFGTPTSDNLNGRILGDAAPLPNLNDPGFRIPILSYQIPVVSGEVQTTELKRPDVGVSIAERPTDELSDKDKVLEVRISKFASLDLLADDAADRVGSITLAPLLPGRRAVIGTSGPVYEFDLPDSATVAPRADRSSFTGTDSNLLYRRFTTLVSQQAADTVSGPGVGDEFIVPNPDVPTPQASLRRFEMIPSPNDNVHQFAVRMNGYLDSQTLLSGGSGFNITVSPESGSSAERTIPPVISIPIDHFSISEPLDQYLIRQLELDPSLDRLFEPNVDGLRDTGRPAEGYFKDSVRGAAFDSPFDLEPELIENQTTPNYRAMHLERLSNPLLPWNPPPMRVTGDPNPQHDPTLPVNPYLPVDAQALDVTAFNSYSEGEADQVGQAAASTEHVHVPTVTSGGGSSQDYGPERRHRRERPLPGVGGDPETVIGFSSNERDRPLGPFALLWDFQPSRLLWRQSQGATVSEILYETVYGSERSGYAVTDNDSVKADGGIIDGVDLGGDADTDVVGNYDLSFEEAQFRGYEEHVIDFPWRMTLGFPSWLMGEFYSSSGLSWLQEGVADGVHEAIDLDGDLSGGDLLGAAEVNNAPVNIGTDGRPVDPALLRETVTTPEFAWPNRPFASAGELMQVPVWGGSRMLSYYSTYNWLHTQMPGFLHDTQVNPYNGEAAVFHDGRDYELSQLNAGTTFNGAYDDDGTPADTNNSLNAAATNDLRFREMLGNFGHLINFFQTARFPAYYEDFTDEIAASGWEESPRGAAHFYRLLDYVHVPSRFVGTDTLLNADVFGSAGIDPEDPRASLAAPYNRVNRYREPGRVNLNTIVGRRDATEAVRIDNAGNGQNDGGFNNTTDRPRLADYWSEVYDGLMHRNQDASEIDYNNADLLKMGHLGPAWRDVALSRRGYVQPTFDPTVDPGDDSFTLGSDRQNQVDYSPRRMHPAFPTLFANPFRAPGEGANVPLAHMVQTGVDATLLRAHPLSPGADGAWGRRGVDERTVKKDSNTDTIANNDGVRDDAGEAGSLTLQLGGGRVANPPGQPVGDRLNADVVLARFQDANGRRGALPDTLLLDAMRPHPTDTNSREVSPRQSVADFVHNCEISKRANPVPLFSGATIEPSLDTERNATTRFSPIQRLSSQATTRSNCYAVWITVGFFEVKPANQNPVLATRYGMDDANGDGVYTYNDVNNSPLTDAQRTQRDFFFRNYPDGWTLGQELDLDTGQNQRHRGFYLVDRTRPVAFRPGEDANVAETILLRRRIE